MIISLLLVPYYTPLDDRDTEQHSFVQIETGIKTRILSIVFFEIIA